MNAFTRVSTEPSYVFTEHNTLAPDHIWTNINPNGSVEILCRNDLYPAIKDNPGLWQAISVLDKAGALANELYGVNSFSITGYENPANIRIMASEPILIANQRVNVIIALDNGFINMATGRV